MVKIDATAVSRQFGHAALHYERHALLQAEEGRKLALLAQNYIPHGSTILDLGCGTGFASEWLGKTHTLIGIDIALGMCVKAAQFMACAQADISRLPFPDQSISGIYSNLALQWVEPENYMREISRVLRKDGVAVINTLAPESYGELRQAFLNHSHHPFVHIFPELSQIDQLAWKHCLNVEEATNTVEKVFYDDFWQLLRSFKNIGAANKHEDRLKGMLTPRFLEKVEKDYIKQHTHHEKITASWCVATRVWRRG